ncbi:retropepsin-like aspartic protease family protein [Cardiobacterium valvarum]|uniref:Clan AA aspartic protease family n=1 Tax=Cardiobacterium valvarum F0432 TaxID=797473 RepID=G9ZJ44_9GAMM|nr:retropepsin-like aspartic protease [Cardiobacterium valvarum]EHM50489.1 clan AA aspartic protease family [Cardiobacterium valvarum F0432]
MQSQPFARRYATTFALIVFLLFCTLFFFAYDRHESTAHLPNRHAQAVDDVLTLKISADGHFRTPGTINGEAVIFMLDTGASGVALSENLARRIGLQPRGRSRVSTANGVTDAGLVTLDELGFGGWQFERVPATVMPQMEDECCSACKSCATLNGSNQAANCACNRHPELSTKTVYKSGKKTLIPCSHNSFFTLLFFCAGDSVMA